MKILLFLLLIVFLLKLKIDNEHFCQEDNNYICKFKNIELPIERSYTKPEIKEYGESRSEELYNRLFNTDYIFKLQLNKDININSSINDYLLKICFIHKDTEVDSIVKIVNIILNDVYSKKMYPNLGKVDKTMKMNVFIDILLFLRKNLFYMIFDNQNKIDKSVSENKYEPINLILIKSHIFNLILDSQDENYLNNNLRSSIYLYLFENNIFEIKKDYHNEIYQNLLVTIYDTLNTYFLMLFNNTRDDLEVLSIKKIRNLIMYNSLIDYNLIKKDLCYI